MQNPTRRVGEKRFLGVYSAARGVMVQTPGGLKTRPVWNRVDRHAGLLISRHPSSTWKHFFAALAASGLAINLEKCVFTVPTLELLGHTISAAFSSPKAQHTAVINSFPVPQGVKKLQIFLGIGKPLFPSWSSPHSVPTNGTQETEAKYVGLQTPGLSGCCVCVQQEGYNLYKFGVTTVDGKNQL